MRACCPRPMGIARELRLGVADFCCSRLKRQTGFGIRSSLTIQSGHRIIQRFLCHKYSQADLRRTRLGSLVICEDKTLLYEEAPQAYKDSQQVIDDMQQAGLIRLIAKLRPVLTFKTQGGRC